MRLLEKLLLILVLCSSALLYAASDEGCSAISTDSETSKADEVEAEADASSVVLGVDPAEAMHDQREANEAIERVKSKALRKWLKKDVTIDEIMAALNGISPGDELNKLKELFIDKFLASNMGIAAAQKIPPDTASIRGERFYSSSLLWSMISMRYHDSFNSRLMHLYGCI